MVSNNIHALQNLLQLTLHFCSKYSVDLCVENTRLQAFSTPDMRATVEHIQKKSPVNIHGTFLNFVSNTSQGAEHVGIIRSVSGNLPHILQRLSLHLNKMAAVMYAGIG